MKDYDKVSKAINYIQANLNQQPSLEDIASHVHLSPHHFQRLFSRWAGVSPKRLLQILTLESAKNTLRETKASVLEVADSIGLSSSSRLYDHFVQLEAVTPSEYKRAGQNLTLYYGFHESPYGQVFVVLTDRGICKIAFVDAARISHALNHLMSEWPNATYIEDREKTSATIQALFADSPTLRTPLSLFVQGTNFQVTVWRALLSLSEGQLTTYGDIAKTIGKPKASRAVGTAIGINPVALVIPCHRVIRGDGNLGGYRWGETRKQAILAREISRL